MSFLRGYSNLSECEDQYISKYGYDKPMVIWFRPKGLSEMRLRMTECDGGHVLLLNKLQYFKEIVTPGIDFPGIRVRI